MNIISALLLFLSILFIIIFLYILFTNDNKIIKFRITKEQIPFEGVPIAKYSVTKIKDEFFTGYSMAIPEKCTARQC